MNMSQNIIETIVGTLVIIIASAFLYNAYKSTEMNHEIGGYNLTANFERADGLNLGSDVKIGGIKIGKVIGQRIDVKSYKAVITINVQKDILLPVDSNAEIVGNGLLGEKYISVVPGSEETYLKENGVIEYTQSSISFESLLGKFIFNSSPSSNATSKTNTTEETLKHNSINPALAPNEAVTNSK